jgi:hypothetical protein
MSGVFYAGSLVLSAETLVNSFNTRTGAVVPASGDYLLSQIGGVVLTSPTNTQILQYNGTNWVNANLTSSFTSVTVPSTYTPANEWRLIYNQTGASTQIDSLYPNTALLVQYTSNTGSTWTTKGAFV